MSNENQQFQTAMEVKRELQQSARIRYESDPRVTLREVADEFKTPLTTIKNWAHADAWVKSHKLLASEEQIRHYAVVKEAVAENGGKQLTNEQVERISFERFRSARAKIADVQQVEMLKVALLASAARNQRDDRQLDRLLKEAAIKEKAFKALSRLWRLDEGVCPLVDDFTSYDQLFSRK